MPGIIAPNWKRKRYENKKILKACHTMEGGCTIQLPGCLGPHAPTVPAHSNSSDDGKGKGIKADDIFVAQSCQSCHDMVDGRKKPPRIYQDETETKNIINWYHERGIRRTIRRLIDNGVIK